ncbi:uronate dehydrogenase [Roseateles sp. YR242]|uniref:NAD-dependent epimerase/dehydratase family protein n=1 Tax=Roseateles sp. YR242 TaxID=1855305 RepID=UPI0008C3DC68|nr:NAD(P)-dependent oxidoreductase [Roseateles sp. YR242]SEL10992.1 uronate dehydrogenase [Roseateles sp. YR242]
MTSPSPDHPTINTLLLTGAAGTVGRLLRAPLGTICRRLVLSDRQPLGTPLAAHEEERTCDLTDRQAVEQLLAGVDAVVHLGAHSVEAPYEQIARVNLDGVFHLYEAARLAGTQRVVFASSNHVTGCYEQGHMLEPTDPPRPDGYYGVSKLFGEGMAQLYWYRYGVESVCLRIGSCLPEPPDRRGLSTWISPRDLFSLVTASLTTPNVGCLVTYAISDNPARWYTDAGWAQLGYRPQDSADAWREQVGDRVFPAGSLMARMQGGIFLDVGPFEAPGSG